jgi:hypothetical protein
LFEVLHNDSGVGLKKETESFKGHKIAWRVCESAVEALRALKRVNKDDFISLQSTAFKMLLMATKMPF